ncbi:glycoside hydrolase family 172 protein [Fastidiosipila sanguinis]|uniref:DUF2961 domain-containing protein n=1 Tax=Fastidiosipila sanguinis TaxID=236753 RepID=A0A2S0KPJ3_9FIRM|nr:glycoside hydrolase family 172 protein [Fastidiosipila sanguinis]AVM42952.1 hypothetical protein C5Q98_06890 [Fastidiosipila sanguinis]
MYQGLGSLSKVTNGKTRSISPENYTGAVGQGGMMELEDGFAKEPARDLGKGWKVNPFIVIEAGKTWEIANIDGPGAINHIWLTPTGNWRYTIIRIYWDDSDIPSVEAPIGDFFCSGWGEYAQLSSLPVCVNPGSAFNCYWSMPFKKNARIELENLADEDVIMYYQIDYELRDVEPEEAYFHAQFRRVNPLPYKDVYTIVDGIEGKGHYVGTYMAWQVNNRGWWGEGEIKFYMDSDEEYPTICGTGTEDYFCGSYNFEDKTTGQYKEFTTPYAGLHQVIRPDHTYNSQMRFGMYRWHLTDPIRFEEKLRVTIQALGWRSNFRYLPLQDDIASVAFWYQDKPAKNMPKLPDRDFLEVI